MKPLDGGNTFYVPNDADGQEFLRLARKYLHKKKFKMKVRGRHRYRASVAESLGESRRRFMQDMPVKYASYFAVYVDWKVSPTLSTQERQYQDLLVRTIDDLKNELNAARAAMNKPPILLALPRFGKRRIAIRKGESHA